MAKTSLDVMLRPSGCKQDYATNSEGIDEASLIRSVALPNINKSVLPYSQCYNQLSHAVLMAGYKSYSGVIDSLNNGNFKAALHECFPPNSG